MDHLTMTQSSIASSFVPSIGYLRGKFLPRSTPSAVVVHTTGCGPIQRWKRERGTKHEKSSPFETGVRIYSELMLAGPHYLVGQLGECMQLCPEEFAAWHVGSARAKQYAHGRWTPSRRFRWWFDRWAPYGIESPLDLADGLLWSGGSVNNNSIGIEVIPQISDPRAPWSPECWATLRALCEDICRRHSFPLSPTHILTHSDAHPISRTTTTTGAPWDPGERQWAGPSLFTSASDTEERRA